MWKHAEIRSTTVMIAFTTRRCSTIRVNCKPMELMLNAFLILCKFFPHAALSRAGISAIIKSTCPRGFRSIGRWHFYAHDEIQRNALGRWRLMAGGDCSLETCLFLSLFPSQESVSYSISLTRRFIRMIECINRNCLVIAKLNRDDKLTKSEITSHQNLISAVRKLAGRLEPTLHCADEWIWILVIKNILKSSVVRFNMYNIYTMYKRIPIHWTSVCECAEICDLDWQDWTAYFKCPIWNDN